MNLNINKIWKIQVIALFVATIALVVITTVFGQQRGDQGNSKQQCPPSTFNTNV